MAKTKTFILVFLILLLRNSAIYPNSSIDSLSIELKKNWQVDDRIRILKELSNEFLDVNIDSSRFYLNRALHLSMAQDKKNLKADVYFVLGRYFIMVNKFDSALYYLHLSEEYYSELSDVVNLAYTYNMIGDCYHDSMDFQLALEYYHKTTKLAEQSKDKILIATNYNNLANVYEEVGKIQEALEHYLKALSIFNKYGKKQNAAITLNNIGIINFNLRNYAKAINYYEKAIVKNQEVGNTYHLCLNYNNIGIAYKELELHEKAMEYYQMALDMATNAGYEDLVIQCYHNMGVLKMNMKLYEEAIENFKRSLNFSEELSLVPGLIFNLISLGEAYQKTGAYELSESHLIKALDFEKNYGRAEVLLEIYDLLYNLYDVTQKYQLAVTYFKKYESIKDSIYNLNRVQQLNELQTRYETNQKDKENVQLKESNTLNQQLILKLRTAVATSVALIVIVLFLLVILYRSQLRQKRSIKLLKEKNTVISEQSSILHTINLTKDKLFSIIAHDMRNPFNTMIGFSNLLLEDLERGESDNLKLYAKQLINASNNGYVLLENLLEWSRSQQGKLVFNPQLLNFNEILKEALEVISDKAKGKRIEIDKKNCEDKMFKADRNMLLVILRNLISNAVKFTYPGGKVWVECIKTDEGYVISVKDNGSGIDVVDQKKLFNLEQNHTSIGTDNEKGSGLGLILVQDFVNKHGGKLWFESEVNKGSKFSFSIPV